MSLLVSENVDYNTVYHQNRETEKSGTALAVPVVPGVPPLH